LINAMADAGCIRCHGQGNRIAYFENDWINLQRPEMSRILRAPLPVGEDGYGLGLCRDRQVDPARQRIRLLVNGYAHAVQPPEAFPQRSRPILETGGDPAVSFTSTDNPHYRQILAILRSGREQALAAPRVDMPDAEVLVGQCRQFVPLEPPQRAPEVTAIVDPDGVVNLVWRLGPEMLGLEAELHRSEQADFTPDDETLLAHTQLASFADRTAEQGQQHYALLVRSPEGYSAPSRVTVDVPPAKAPQPPTQLEALPASGAARFRWQGPIASLRGYHVYRWGPNADTPVRISEEPVRSNRFVDTAVETDQTYRYHVCSVSRRGVESAPTPPLEITPTLIEEPVFVAEFEGQPRGRILGKAQPLAGKKHGKANAADGILDLRQGGHVMFPHLSEFELNQPFSVECWVWFDQPGQIPVVVGCGYWNRAGWFLQSIGGRWRWHVGGFDCDGGHPQTARWMHLVATYDGETARVYEAGKLVAEKAGTATSEVWPGGLHLGQYSQPHAQFQVHGRLAGLKIYHRVIDSDEAAERAQTPPD
jgi:hypothetical protein